MTSLLLIEDDDDIRVLIERFLRRCGYQVTATVDGELGLKAFAEAPFDIVLTDGLLPKKSGFEVAAAIRKMPQGKDVGIVMMSAAFKGPKARKDAFDDGVDAFFTKPFVLTDLREKLAALLLRHGKPAPTPLPPGAAVAARPTPKPASSTGFMEPLHTPAAVIVAARPAPKLDAPPPPLPDAARIDKPIDAARALLTCARHRLSGVVELVDESSHMRIAFLRGVVVGASDNLREHLLGERLWKQGRLTTEQMRVLNARMAKANERVAEALLALGYCTPDEALGFVDEQAMARVRRALLWTGSMRVLVDESRAQQMANVSLDVVDAILSFGFAPAHQSEAAAFVAASASEKIAKAPDLDALLLAVARTKPDAKLPAALFAGDDLELGAVASSSSAGEVYAAWLSGLVRLPSDPAPDRRPLPDIMRAGSVGGGVDRALASKICASLLRARGRSYYEMLDVEASSSSEEVMKRLDVLARDVGPAAALGKSLGPASAAARELWSLLDDAYRTFSDASSRSMYDAILAPLPASTYAPKNEDAFLEGQSALQSGDFAKALGCFEIAAASKPKDVEYQSYLGWTQVLAGDKGGVTRLMLAMRDSPQSMRPLFFLGLVAAKEGDVSKARALLEECVRRAPLDVEVETTLRSLS